MLEKFEPQRQGDTKEHRDYFNTIQLRRGRREYIILNFECRILNEIQIQSTQRTAKAVEYIAQIILQCLEI